MDDDTNKLLQQILFQLKAVCGLLVLIAVILTYR